MTVPDDVAAELANDLAIANAHVKWMEAEVERLRAELEVKQSIIENVEERLAAERERCAHCFRLLERCHTILGNMALENEGAIFNRWPINHEPLRADAKNILPDIAAAIRKGEPRYLTKREQQVMRDALRAAAIRKGKTNDQA